MVRDRDDGDTVAKDGQGVRQKRRARGRLGTGFGPNRHDLAVLRVVVRNGFSHDMADLFLRDLDAATVRQLALLRSEFPAQTLRGCSGPA